MYPVLQRGGKPMPLAVWTLAAASCVWNGSLQARLRGLMPVAPSMHGVDDTQRPSIKFLRNEHRPSR